MLCCHIQRIKRLYMEVFMEAQILEVRMEFKYDVVKKIKNQDFASNSRGLLAACEDIKEKYDKGDYKGCCIKLRIENEEILRYLYDRIIGIKDQNRRPTAGAILRDENFKSEIGDQVLCYKAALIQKEASNFAAHKEKEPYETVKRYKKRIKSENEAAAIVAADLMSHFSVVLERSINFINENLPSVRGKLEIFKEKRINFETGTDESLLIASLQDVVDRKEYAYTWKIKGRDSIYATKVYYIKLNKEWLEGQTIVLEARRKDGTQEPLTAEIGPIGRIDIILEKSANDANKKPRLEGKVVTRLKSANGTRSYLEASVEMSTCKGPFYYTWHSGGEELVKGWGKTRLYLQGEKPSINKAIYCSVNAKGWIGNIVGDPYTLRDIRESKNKHEEFYDEVEVPTEEQKKKESNTKDATSLNNNREVINFHKLAKEKNGSECKRSYASLVLNDTDAMIEFGDEAYNTMDYEAAINWYMRAAQNGNPIAKAKYDAVCKEELEVRIGEAISEGISADKLEEFDAILDPKLATKWLEANRPDYKQIVSAEREKMQKEFGYIFSNGDLCEDPKLLAKAENGDCNAMLTLGKNAFGKGNYIVAINWFRLAADRESDFARISYEIACEAELETRLLRENAADLPFEPLKNLRTELPKMKEEFGYTITELEGLKIFERALNNEKYEIEIALGIREDKKLVKYAYVPGDRQAAIKYYRGVAEEGSDSARTKYSIVCKEELYYRLYEKITSKSFRRGSTEDILRAELAKMKEEFGFVITAEESLFVLREVIVNRLKEIEKEKAVRKSRRNFSPN